MALAETVEAVTGKRPAFQMCPGLLETRWYARKGIPAFAYGPGFLEVAHGPNEVVEIERIYQNTIIYAMMAGACWASVDRLHPRSPPLQTPGSQRFASTGKLG